MTRVSWPRKHSPEAPSGEERNGQVRFALRERASVGRAPARARRVLQPLPLAGVALTLVGLVVMLGYGAAAGKQTAVLVATRDLPAGTVLTAADLQGTEVGANRSVLGSLTPQQDEATVVGRRLAEPIGANEPLTNSVLVASMAAPAAFTLAVPAEHALGGQLLPGDRVTVLATFATAGGGATTRAVANDLLVLAVGQVPRLNDPNTTTIPVTVALPDQDVASRLALANSVAKIDLLREPPGANSSTVIPTAGAPGA